MNVNLTSLSRALVMACSLLSAGACHSPPPTTALDKAPVNDYRAANDALLKADHPLKSVTIIEKLVGQKALSSQTAAQSHAMLGIESLAQKVFWEGLPKAPTQPTVTASLDAVDALTTIVEAAKIHRIVILNEDHRHQRHRAFALSIAVALRPVGYTHLGLEALEPGSGKEVRDSGLKLSHAFYGADPLYADLVRQSRAMGYYVFDYEARKDQAPTQGSSRDAEMRARERAQAENIAAVISNDPTAKIFLYVGGGHGMKLPTSTGLEMMAHHLNRITGLPILSIDQQAGTPQDPSLGADARYRAIESLLPTTGSTVLRDKGGKWRALPGYDMSVFHPRLPDLYGRAGWLDMGGYRKFSLVKLPSRDARTLLRARALPRVPGDIAMDQALIAPTQTEAALFLPVGKYALFREYESGWAEDLGHVVIR